jgi:hypothetical protein
MCAKELPASGREGWTDHLKENKFTIIRLPGAKENKEQGGILQVLDDHKLVVQAALTRVSKPNFIAKHKSAPGDRTQ